MPGSDELFVKVENFDGGSRNPSFQYAPAGFTLADVRRLAEEMQSYVKMYHYPEDEDALAPFADLLKENKDG